MRAWGGWPRGGPRFGAGLFPILVEIMKAETIVALALAGFPNAEIARIVGSRPRRVREVISAAIKAGVPIAPNAERMALRRAGNGPSAPVPRSPLAYAQGKNVRQIGLQDSQAWKGLQM